MKYRLGLDVGTNSLGWSVLKLDAEGTPTGIKAAGSRIFSDGRDSKSKATLAADRREARSARRRRDRYKQRRTYLLNALAEAGLFPAKTEAATRVALQKLNPLELRARLLIESAADILVDLKIRGDAAANIAPEHLVGRALFHLNQRRGFQSNRKDRSEETTSGKVSGSVRMLMQEMGLIGPPMPPEEYKTLSKEEKKEARQAEAQAREDALAKLAKQKDRSFGSFLWQRQQDGKQTRARPGAGDDGKLYDVYPQRAMYEDEFDKIWEAQAAHFSKQMADKVLFHNIIFTQRLLKPQTRGRCTYMSEHDRTFRAMPSFQRYRMYQEVNNLEWATANGRHYLTDYPQARDAIIDLLEKPPTKADGDIAKDKLIVWGNMKKILKRMDIVEGHIEFNYESEKRKGFDSNLTSNIMQHEDYVGADWHGWDLDKQDRFIDLILDDELDDEEVKGHLMTDYGLGKRAAVKCMSAHLVEGTAGVSQQAALLMLEKMRDGVEGEDGLILPIQSDAAAIIAAERDDFTNPMRRPKTDEADFEPLPHLPYYGEAFRDGRHIIPGSNDDKDAGNDLKYYGGVTNPTVHIALNQIRQVINELIDRFGHPHSIAIELGRELPEGADKRNEIEREQKKNQDKNEHLDKILIEQGQQINRDNRLRVELWEQLAEDPAARKCPFSGKTIGIADLFDGTKTNIEHLIPFSVSLDDSKANKVIATRQANQDKGKRTPFEAFGHSPDGYNWDDIFERAKALPKPKQWRFQEDAMEIWRRDHADFTGRHLNDTRYIGRLTREYLENICHIDKIDVLTGRLTALLRGHWGLNSVLQGDNLPEDAQKKKNRDDHRHHAIDAIVIGMINRSTLQKVATAANRAEGLNLDRLFPKDENGHSAINPWDGFREDVKEAVRDITVSHKAKKKLQGQLHKEFTYGIANKQVRYQLSDSASSEPIKTKVVLRRSVNDFSTKKHVSEIRDKTLRQGFLKAFERDGKEGFLNFARDREKPIRHLRVQLERTVQPIRVSPKRGRLQGFLASR